MLTSGAGCRRASRASAPSSITKDASVPGEVRVEDGGRDGWRSTASAAANALEAGDRLLESGRRGLDFDRNRLPEPLVRGPQDRGGAAGVKDPGEVVALGELTEFHGLAPWLDFFSSA